MSETAVATSPRQSTLTAAWAFVRHHVLTLYSFLFFAYLLLPIAIVVIFSFNHPAGNFNYSGRGLRGTTGGTGTVSRGSAARSSCRWRSRCSRASSRPSLGTLIALALVRYGFRGRGATNILIFLPLSTPEIVLGASLLTLFLNLNVVFGFWTILIAHIMFCISFAVVTVKARLIGFDRHLEEAAMDLGANEWATFRKVTLPLIAPAILAAMLLCFAISIDDFVVTYFNSGSQTTFPLFVWGAARVGAPPQVNVIGTAIFAVAVIGMLVNVLVQMRRERTAAAVT